MFHPGLGVHRCIKLTFCSESHLEKVKTAVFNAGAGRTRKL